MQGFTERARTIAPLGASASGGAPTVRALGKIHWLRNAPGPPVGSPRVMALSLAALFAAAAAIGAALLVLPHPSSFDEPALWFLIAAELLAALALFEIAPRAPAWSGQLGVAALTLLVTATAYFTHEDNGVYAALYIWAGFYTFFFFGLQGGLLQLGLIAVSYAWVLTEVPHSSPLARWLLAVGTIAAAGVLLDILVRRERRAATESERRANNLAAVDVVAHELARHADAEAAGPAICDAALRVAGAAAASLWRPAPDGTGLVIAASTRAELQGAMLPFVGRPAGAIRAFTTGEPFFVARAKGHPEVDEAVVDRVGADSCLWHPVIRDGVPQGVLALYWDRPVTALDQDLAQVVGVLAAEASIAIGRSQLLTRLEKAARTDDLTGLLNRRAWDEELVRELARAARIKSPLSVAMIDLDNFKAYNDEYGHQAGDRLLKQTAAAWRERLRVTDILARYGGEEFALALPYCGSDEAERLLERVRVATPETQTCSVGIATWNRTESADQLIGRADAALYAAKRAGRDRVILARGG
jgi:diguanylate cyclase (GGDEF)-like protein